MHWQLSMFQRHLADPARLQIHGYLQASARAGCIERDPQERRRSDYPMPMEAATQAINHLASPRDDAPDRADPLPKTTRPVGLLFPSKRERLAVASGTYPKSRLGLTGLHETPFWEFIISIYVDSIMAVTIPGGHRCPSARDYAGQYAYAASGI